MDKRKLSGRVEPIRTGRAFGERNLAGKLYEVDPEAVARLKAYIVEREKLQPPGSQPAKGDILANIRRTQHERQAELNARMRKPEIPADVARDWHVKYYQAGDSIANIAERASVGRKRLTVRWKELGLPISRKVDERRWQPEDEEP